MADELDLTTHPEDLEPQYSMANLAEEMAAAGFDAVQPPEYPCPILRPRDLLNNNPEMYAMQYAQFSAWLVYSKSVIIFFEGHILEYKNILQRMLVKGRMDRRGRNTKNVDRLRDMNDEIESMPEYVRYSKLQERMIKLKGMAVAKEVQAATGKEVLSRYLPYTSQETAIGRRS